MSDLNTGPVIVPDTAVVEPLVPLDRYHRGQQHDREWTDSSLSSLCAEWQEILRLQDWDIRVRWGTRDELPDEWGRVRSNSYTKRAVIQLADPHDHDPGQIDRYWPYDPEVTLVHELLHLHLTDTEDGDETEAQTRAQEVAINRIAEALVRLKRGGDAA